MVGVNTGLVSSVYIPFGGVRFFSLSFILLADKGLLLTSTHCMNGTRSSKVDSGEKDRNMGYRNVCCLCWIQAV